MDNKKDLRSKYKKLTDTFTVDDKYTRQSKGDEVIYTTKNKEEFEKKKLEKQQTKYFRGQWQKVKTHIHEKSLIYETQRYPSYIDYDLMEYYPIIGQALDILMEESTTTNEHGKILNIYSESKRVQEELKELFYNRLNIHTNLPMWVRNMAKYGDNFVYLQIDDEYGIVGAKQLANIEVERIEGSVNSRMRAHLQNDDDETVFRWKSTDIAEFKYWQIAHFRLLTDDRKMPYGVSVLEKVRRIWKNLLLVEDAMRTIRLLRAIDRRAYYVNVGNIDPNDVQAYIEEIGSRFKRKRHVDPNTGQEDLKYNVMGYDQDYVIPIRDEDDGTRIETIQGSSNVADIADIEYDLEQLFAGLGIPKPFLQYADTAGDGKNLAMQDVRFARKINRLQQAALQELNKIAMVHLLLIGLDDELHNFELTLNNPSTQSEAMRTEHEAAKISAFKDAVSDANGQGIAAYSVTEAMKKILNKTDDEIKLSLEQQFMERVASKEITDAATKITTSTLFDGLYKLYGVESTGEQPVAQPEGEDGGTDGGSGSGGGGFGGFGGEDLGSDEDLGLDVGDDGGGDLEAELDASLKNEAGGGAEGETPETETPEAPETEKVGESFEVGRSGKNILNEKLSRISDLMKNLK